MVMTYRAKFYNSRGDFAGKKSFSGKEQKFVFKNKAYVIDLKASYEEESVLPFWKRRNYIYNVERVDPVSITPDGIKSTISPEILEILLETKVARDLNDLSKKGLAEYLTLKNILIVGVGIFLVYYISTHGGIGGLFHG